MPRPTFVPSDHDRRVVRMMSAYGIPHDDIARVVGITGKTLRLHFRDELDMGAIQATAKVAKCAFHMATSGKVPAATFFWLKARAGWRDRDATVVEVAQPTLGKKEQEKAAAETAGRGSDWGDDLLGTQH